MKKTPEESSKESKKC